MRTCSVCGCYLPDKWNTCPACHRYDDRTVRDNRKVSDSTVFIVNAMDIHGLLIDREFFGIYDNACHYAERKAKEIEVSHTEVVRNGVLLICFFK